MNHLVFARQEVTRIKILLFFPALNGIISLHGIPVRRGFILRIAIPGFHPGLK